jgi:transposase
LTHRISIKLSRQVRRRLERHAQKTTDALYRTRVLIVLRYDAGWGCDRIAEALHCAPKHAVATAHRYLDDGEDGLLDRRAENGIAKVDEDFLAALEATVASQPRDHGWARSTWSRELLAKELRRQTGVRVSLRTVGRALDRIGARHGMARPVPRVEWSAARKSRRVRQILAKVKNLPRGDVAFYADELDVHLNPKIGRDWMLHGTQKEVPTPGKNQKRYLYGALAVDGTDLVYTTSDRKNTDGFIAFLERLRATYPKAKRIHLVLDNYVIHKSKKALRYLEKAAVFVLHFLPPYSPEHNRIERTWRDLHGNVTRNHRCASMTELMRRVRDWLRREAKRRRSRSKPTATVRRRAAA